jgi:hypothetical protein
MRLNSNKTRVVSYSRKTNILSYDYRLCHSVITCTTSIKDLGVFFDSKLYFHNHVDFLFSERVKLLGLIHSITFSFSSLDCLFVLYFVLVRPRLQYASVVWNSIMSSDSKQLERIQQKFASVCFYRFFPSLPYSYVFASMKLILPWLSTWRHHLDALFFPQAYCGLKSCSSLLDIVSFRVPHRNVRDFTMFSVSPPNKHCPPARCAFALFGLFVVRAVSLGNILRACADPVSGQVFL